MRFTENGPWIPDELLNARDNGRVVLFCGSGVSRARARLPDFFGLAEAVVRELKVSEDSDACKVLKKAQEIGEELAISGLISADRVFALLEREFEIADIQGAVAKSLAPKAPTDLSAHQILLRLAATHDSNRTQLVTTNFDRLFQECNPNLQCYEAPRLPNSSHYDILDGIVYLHGRVTSDYGGAAGHGFVLSSSDFGYAYLSDGWATEFFREIVRKYVVLFVGYSADDPPIHYLLEGLRRTNGSSNCIYAFQADESDEAVARWGYKGVEAIPYSHADAHTALWDTLERWAERADDPVAWRAKTIDRAMDGPEVLAPFQRGQVAHIVSTIEGAREFARRKPPAEWLCVFDPLCRCAQPPRMVSFHPEISVINPFSSYGLDSDEVPEKSAQENRSVAESAPAGAWDAFAVTMIDRQDLVDENFPVLRGEFAAKGPRLPKRIAWLAGWIADVADQPTTVWWAARQTSLHPEVRSHLQYRLNQDHQQFSFVVSAAWRYLLEAWNTLGANPRWCDLKSEIDQEGWTSGTVRRFGRIWRAYLTVEPGDMCTLLPPKKDSELRLSDLVRLQVECPIPPATADIPDEFLADVMCELRKNIELAVQLSEEVDDRHRFYFSPIVSDNRPDISDYGKTEGLSGYVIYFSSLFEKLVNLDIVKARREFLLWPVDDDIAFSRLRLWAAGESRLKTPSEFHRIMKEMSDGVFWGSRYRRDLLVVLTNRWSTLPMRSRMQIEKRLLEGPPRWNGEDDADYAESKAWETLNRLQWLLDNGCSFSCDVRKEIAERRPFAPKWKPEYARHAADSMETRAAWVETDTEHSALLHEPVSSILSKAVELASQREAGILEHHDPFAGLCAARPVRAMCALSLAAKKDEYPKWAWETFLYSDARERDKPKFTALVAERLCQIPDEKLGKMLHSATFWFQRVAEALSIRCPDAFDRTALRLIDVLSEMPAEGRSAISSSGRDRDRATEAINSPGGHIVRAVLQDSRVKFLHEEGDSCQKWLSLLQKVLAVPGDPRRHAITMLSHHLRWLHSVAREWTERHLLSVLEGEDKEDRETLVDGFLWNPCLDPSLYLRLKPALLLIVCEPEQPLRDMRMTSLASFVLSGWFAPSAENEERLVNNDEFHDLLLRGGDDFRSRVLWQIERQFKGDKQQDRLKGRRHAQELFRDVWPRQKVVKNPKTSARLCELLLSNHEAFLPLVDLVLPLMTTIPHGVYRLRHDETEKISRDYPERFLAVLHAVLPESVCEWPYGIGGALEAIAETDETLLSDHRFVELKRRWDSR